MAYRELVRKRNELSENSMSVLREVVLHITYFISGLLVSKGALFGEMSPFGASFSAAIPFMYMPSGLIGCVIGYLIRNPLDSFRYIAVIISIGALRWVLNEFKKVSQSRFFPCVVAFVPVFITSLALTFSSASEVTQVSMCFMEATLSSAGAYFMGRTVTLFSGKKSLYSLSSQELACIVMTSCILLLSLSAFTFGYISVGRIIAVLVVLFCARYGSVSGGCIAGVATGIVFSLSSNELMFLCAGFAFGGLMGGLFSPLGKLAVALSMLLCNVTLSFSTNDTEIVFAIFVETVIASAVFMVLPKSLGNFVSNVFSNDRDSGDNEAVRRALTMRLSFASKTLSNVSSCVNSVSDKLYRMYSPNAQWVYDNATSQTCSKCGMRYYCFEKCKELTNEDLHKLTPVLKENGFVKESDIEENFTKKCCRTRELAESITQSYNEFLQCEAADRRIAQVRSVVASQFAGLSDILYDLSEEFSEYERYDSQLSEAVTEALSTLSLCVIDCSCRYSRGKGMIVEAQLIVTPKTNISKSQLTNEISRVCGRRFDSPSIVYEGDRLRLTLCERPMYDLQIGSSQHVFNNGELCGDCINYFNNGLGSTVLMLSDGMGTGGSAAVDSNMAVSIMSKLLKAGLSYDCSLAVVNSSLMIKSDEESLATLDVVDFNLFSGKAQINKAGACTTYVKKNSKLYRKDMQSLPIGILNEVQFAKEDITLSEGDMILMISDGALFGDDKWIEKLFMSWGDESMEELSQKVVDEAIKRRNDGHDDDITALAVKVIEN